MPFAGFAFVEAAVVVVVEFETSEAPAVVVPLGLVADVDSMLLLPSIQKLSMAVQHGH